MLIIPAILQSFSSLKDKTLKIVFETNEPTPEQLLGVANNIQKFGFLAFKEDVFKEKEKEAINSLDTEFEDKGKSRSMRLRNVLYVNFEQNNEGYETFNDFYNSKMEKLINHFKNKLQ